MPSFYVARSILFVLFISSNCSSAHIADGCPHLNNRTQQQLEKAYQRAGNWGDLFASVSMECLREAKIGQSISNSCAAMWEEVFRTNDELSGGSTFVLNNNKLNYVLGFIEGRMALQVPGEWKSIFLNAKTDGPRRMVFAKKNNAAVYHVSKCKLCCPVKLQLKEHGSDAIEIEGLESPFIFPRTLLDDESSGPIDCISAADDRERVYLALHGMHLAPYQLVCFDKHRGTVKWSSQVVAEGDKIMRGGRSFHWVSIRSCGNRVLVFGIGPTCLYIEEFDPTNGLSRFRFRTAS